MRAAVVTVMIVLPLGSLKAPDWIQEKKSPAYSQNGAIGPNVPSVFRSYVPFEFRGGTSS